MTVLLTKIAEAKSRAERSYEYLSAKYPTAKSVIKSYSLFLLEVYNDEKQAQVRHAVYSQRLVNLSPTVCAGVLGPGER